jgi:hypothetical protein
LSCSTRGAWLAATGSTRCAAAWRSATGACARRATGYLIATRLISAPGLTVIGRLILSAATGLALASRILRLATLSRLPALPRQRLLGIAESFRCFFLTRHGLGWVFAGGLCRFTLCLCRLFQRFRRLAGLL